MNHDDALIDLHIKSIEKMIENAKNHVSKTKVHLIVNVIRERFP